MAARITSVAPAVQVASPPAPMPAALAAFAVQALEPVLLTAFGKQQTSKWGLRPGKVALV